MSGRKMIKATLVSGLHGRGQGWHLQVYVKGPMCVHVPFIIYENISGEEFYKTVDGVDRGHNISTLHFLEKS